MHCSRKFMHRLCVVGLWWCALTLGAAEARTTYTISGADFWCNNQPTYAGRFWQGHRIEGLLGNIRVVQATFDDLNPQTAARWSYPDTGRWNPERNVSEFIAAMPLWRAHGLLAITVNFQGGSPEGYSSTQPWLTSGFSADGTLREDCARRMARVLDAADRLGMAVILGYFYFGQDQRLRDEAAIIHATDVATRWVLAGGWRNVLVEIANETDSPAYDYSILRPQRIHELIQRVRDTQVDGRRLLVGTSCGGGILPNEKIVRASDFLLLHGNGVNDPAGIGEMVRRARLIPGYRPMPIIFNEDDHEGFAQVRSNFSVACESHASWGWFDYRRPGESLNEGYQSPPVDWGISSKRKRDFFTKLKAITGN